jgi:Tol biopolymer transport system component
MARSVTEVTALRRLARVYRRLLLLAVPAALAGCQDGADPLAPEGPAVPGEISASVASAADRIAFSVFAPPEEADVWTMASAGGSGVHLTSFAGEELNPVWSPDHQRIAFARARNGKNDIMLMNADGSNKHWALPSAPAYSLNQPSWSPDGKFLLVQVWITASKIAVGRIDLTAGTWTLVAPAFYYGGLAGRYPIYSKDGKWIYYVAANGLSIHRFQPNGGDTYLTGFAQNVGDLALSPDGTRMAVAANHGSDNYEILLIDLSSYQTKQLTHDSHNDNHPAWSPDGTRIAFASSRSGTNQVYTMNSATGGNLHKLTNKANGAGYPSWYR